MRLRVRNRGVQQFSLAADTHPLASRHGQGTCQEPGDPRGQDEARVHSRCDHTEDERQVRHQPVVHAEHRRAESPGEGLAGAGGQAAHHFAVNMFVGRHLRGGVGIAVVGGALFGALRHGQDEHGSEHVGEERRQSGGDRRSGGGQSAIPEEFKPVFLVASFGFGQFQEDFAFRACSAFRKRPVGACFDAFFCQVAAPAMNLGARRLSGGL